MKSFVCLLTVMMLVLTTLPAFSAEKNELVVYSARKEHLIKPLFDAYTDATGVKIRYITDKAGPLLQRLKAEGEHTQADLLITVDAGNLWHAANEGLLEQIDSSILKTNVPEALRDPQGRWFGLSKRCRTIVYSTERIDPAELTTYEALGEEQWKGRLLLRTAKKVYNQSLVAMLIAEHGEAKTEKIVRSWVANLAAAPFSNDTKTMEAILAGQGDVAVVNTYYFGRLQKKNSDLKLALFWPNQKTSGVHVNVSGAGVVKASKNQEAATRFLEWLSSAEAQNLFADANMEYPVNPAVKANDQVAAWGAFKGNEMNLAKAGELQAAAIKLMDRAGYR
ncbi:Fe(3+) ABC transporter substrate-binding protein [Syntrophotalea acetylenivorans]|uniref:Fe(3+) ABC transporter substrate-binding protein n=1 Tax=Syntrophotalea acetylenivorans TaxID=1842532 RepID=A0A1L3GM51_9BACT|nr:extracellular solute-binding protein [Syntrophotalea acetylenivorans]APG27002.1 Fe(3+) ABC transporter substrate-binding protein [Syntrophotalea acetylenivorans]